MPYVRIDLAQGKSPAFLATLGDIVYRAMVEVISVPENDKYIVVTEHAQTQMHVTPAYLGLTYTADIIFIQIFLIAGRSTEQKKKLYKRINDDIHAKLKVRREDVFITLSGIAKDDISFGNGEAQYAH
jgi:4-oxalocrotonate tautomerase